MNIYFNKLNSQKYAKILANVNKNWYKWVYQPLTIPVQMNFMTPKIREAQELAQSYIDGKTGFAKEFQALLPNQKYLFFNYLLENSKTITLDSIRNMDKDLSLSNMMNPENKYRWFTLCVQFKYYDFLDNIKSFLSSVGRNKMVVPIYQAFNTVDRDLGIAIF